MGTSAGTARRRRGRETGGELIFLQVGDPGM